MNSQKQRDAIIKNMRFRSTEISQDLIEAANTTEQWLSNTGINPPNLTTANPEEILFNIKIIGEALVTLSNHKKAKTLKWRIYLSAHQDLAQLITAILNQLTQKQFMPCLILLRSAQELAQTTRTAIEQDALFEWYEYSIRKDMKDIKQIKLLAQTNAENDNSTKDSFPSLGEVILQLDTKLKNRKALQDELSKNQSRKPWNELRRRWEPHSEDFAKILKDLDPTNNLPNMHLASWFILNGYVHARSRAFGHQSTATDVINQLSVTMIYIKLLGKEFVERFNPK